mmetsp:Transcript_16288/g.46502  ORF Transcript_16288/g.46502 Transcript_16288/m.46502 type:complete len:233 (-) Transcript_16288:206-904(-)
MQRPSGAPARSLLRAWRQHCSSSPPPSAPLAQCSQEPPRKRSAAQWCGMVRPQPTSTKSPSGDVQLSYVWTTFTCTFLAALAARASKKRSASSMEFTVKTSEGSLSGELALWQTRPRRGVMQKSSRTKIRRLAAGRAARERASSARYWPMLSSRSWAPGSLRSGVHSLKAKGAPRCAPTRSSRRLALFLCCGFRQEELRTTVHPSPAMRRSWASRPTRTSETSRGVREANFA